MEGSASAPDRRGVAKHGGPSLQSSMADRLQWFELERAHGDCGIRDNAASAGRRCYGIEIDPIYVDTAIKRWERMTGREVQNAKGQTFAQAKLDRGIAN
jgi:hypothetical protein